MKTLRQIKTRKHFGFNKFIGLTPEWKVGSYPLNIVNGNPVKVQTNLGNSFTIVFHEERNLTSRGFSTSAPTVIVKSAFSYSS